MFTTLLVVGVVVLVALGVWQKDRVLALWESVKSKFTK